VPYSPDRARRADGQVLPGAGPPTARAPGARHAHDADRVPRRVAAHRAGAEGHCDRKGVALSHFAVAWVLANKAVSSVIAGRARWRSGRTTSARLDCVVDAADEARVDCAREARPSVHAGIQRPGYPLAGR
jgi:aryl-alcohol dehydrogenase-like predicted oxidoreductase